jgi:hypothetical protein
MTESLAYVEPFVFSAKASATRPNNYSAPTRMTAGPYNFQK